MINISTDEVYGSIESGSATEDSILAPSSPYSASKAAADLLCMSYARTHGIRQITTRSSNNYGKYQHVEKLIPRCVNELLNGRPVPLYGTGLNRREWIHVSDNCRAILRIIHDGVIGDVYNISSKTELTNIEVAQDLLKILNLGEDRIRLVNDRKGHDFRYSITTDKLQSLGHENVITWEDGILGYVRWHQSNLAHWDKAQMHV